ncbi:patatin-like phospholipase family protein [Vibrio kagoshimensis]|uniref:patatin-like phospholipase family protein n=1 Tax=Vibrio kagoshimensis TaxID=2910244 RepID=UPI003D24DCF3
MTHRFYTFLIMAGVLSGCSSINQPNNVVKDESKEASDYTLTELTNSTENDVTIILAFSGGGTRAAALSYGVLEQLRDTQIVINGKQKRLLDEVDVISSVSGGSFTSAYYGIHQDKIFDSYKSDFLYRDVKDDLVSIILSPVHWFSSLGRTDAANQYYEENIFGSATFNDIDPQSSPYIIINASDITTGLRFSFIQEYFDLLCSDIGEYPISKAVAASAAVPVLFEPVVLENYEGCYEQLQRQAAQVVTNDLSYQSKKTIQDIRDYSDKDSNRYIHLVDGGITDNLGLLAIYDLLELGNFHSKHVMPDGVSTHQVIVISVDASTSPELGIGQSMEVPSVPQTLNSITDIQLHRYNDATKALFTKSMEQWAKESSTETTKVYPHFIDIGFEHTKDLQKKNEFNQVPTDFTLDKGLVDALIEEGQLQLKTNDEFNRVLQQLNSEAL